MNKQRTENNQTLEQSELINTTTLTKTRKKKNRRKYQSHGQFDTYNQVLWKQSPTSLTRDKAPSHKIPKAQRFSTITIDNLRCNKYATLQENISVNKTGISFCKAVRPEHFAKEQLKQNPSQSSYQLSRFMDKTNYKTKSERSISSPQGGSELKGATINNFFNYHKTYVSHSKNRVYQPQNTIDNPGPSHYKINWSSKRKQIKYTFRMILKKADQMQLPGPSQYNIQLQKQRPKSFNAKGTFPKSQRTYLNKLPQSPASNLYNIPRFLQKRQ